MPRADIARKRRQPAAAEETAGVAHGVDAADARPIGKRRAGDNKGAKQFGPDRRQHHDGPARLAISDHAGFALCLGVQRNHLLEEDRFRAADVFDRLAGHRVGQKADKVAGMACLHGDANFAVRLEAADARTMPGAGIDDHKRPGLRV